MRIGVFYRTKTQPRATILLSRLEEAGFQAVGFLLGRDEEGDLEEIAGLIDPVSELTHVIIAYSSSCDDAAWPLFLLGFAVGREAGLILYPDDDIAALPSFLSRFPVERTVGPIVAYLSAELDIINRTATIEQARADLLDRGLGLTDAAMARAAEAGWGDAVHSFLVLGFSPNTADTHGVPVLVLAARNQHEDLALELLRRGADPNAVSRDRGSTALLEAAASGLSGLAAALIESGADLEIAGHGNQTALIAATSTSHDEIAIMLIRSGADLTRVDALGMTARKYAELFGRTEVLNAIKEVENLAELTASERGGR